VSFSPAGWSLLIDGTFDDLPGVHGTRTSGKLGRSVLELDTAVSTPDDVVAAIAELGSNAEWQPADQERR